MGDIEDHAAALRVTAFGPLAATIGGRQVNLGGPKPCAVLAGLLVEPGRWVSIHRLIDGAWPDDRGTWDRQRSRLQVNVNRLNKALSGAAGPRRIVQEHSGYRLSLDTGELDLLEFDHLCTAAAGKLAARQHGLAVELATSARRLSTGTPFGDLATEPFLERRVDELLKQRREVTGVLAAALLEVGRADEAVVVSGELVAASPYNERWRYLHVLALYRAEGSDRALAELRGFVDELGGRKGLEPGTDLADLERRIFDGDEALASPRGGAALPGTVRPQGVRTFVFVGLGPAASAAAVPGATAQSGFEAVVRATFREHHGDEFRRAGTGLCAAFERPLDGLLAARDVALGLRAPVGDAASRVRATVVVHTGTADDVGAAYVGAAPLYAARLLDAGHADQVLVSAATRELVEGDVPPGTALDDIGPWQFAGGEPVRRVFQLRHVGLPTEFPPLRSAVRPAGRVPRYTTGFIGRTDELADVGARLRPGALVTITGPGGIGKSRLAVEVATRVAEPAGGLRYCDVSLADDEVTLHEGVARSVGVTLRSAEGARGQLAAALAGAPTLLVLDGCEHLRAEASALVHEVLATGAPVRVLATSRRRLHVVGEEVVALEPLAVPAAAEDGASSPAVELLVLRAEAVGADLDPGAPAVADLARRLEGVPLAIELAATLLPSQSPASVVERLGHHVEALRGPEGLPDRQRTLRATFEWTFELLRPDARRLLAALSVFRGTWGLDAAEAVAPTVDVDPDAVAGLTAELVDLSIVRATAPTGGTARYGMLDTVRMFAAEHLEALGRAEAVADCHADHYLRLARQAVRHRRGPDEAAWVLGVQAEADNMRSAYRHFAGRRPVAGLRLVAALGDELLMGERLEVGRWAVDLAETPAVEGEPLRVEVLGLAANAVMLQGDLEEALRLARAAIALAAGPPGSPPAWLAHNVMAIAGLISQEQVPWEGHLDEMEAASAATGDPLPHALALWDRVFVAQNRGGLEAAERIRTADEAAAELGKLAERHDCPSIRSMALDGAGRAAVLRGDHGPARDLFHQALGAAEAARNVLMANIVRRDLAAIPVDGSDERHRVLADLREVATQFVTSGNLSEQAQTAMTIVGHLVALDVHAPAARALVALQRTALRRTDAHAGLLALTLGQLGPEERATALREGERMRLADVATFLLDVVDGLGEEEGT